MTANELRSKYIEFFKSKNHVEISGKSLIPDNDPSDEGRRRTHDRRY